MQKYKSAFRGSMHSPSWIILLEKNKKWPYFIPPPPQVISYTTMTPWSHCNKLQSWFTVKYWLALVRQTYKVCLCHTDKSDELWSLSRSYLGENGTTGVTYFEISVMQHHTGLTWPCYITTHFANFTSLEVKSWKKKMNSSFCITNLFGITNVAFPLHGTNFTCLQFTCFYWFTLILVLGTRNYFSSRLNIVNNHCRLMTGWRKSSLHTEIELVCSLW